VAKQLYLWADAASGAFLVLMIASAPWLFGATERWSMNLLNGLGFAAGILLALKWLLRWSSGALAVDQLLARNDPGIRPGLYIVRAMAVLTAAVLFYVLISALNARATFVPGELRFEYHRYLPWLPFTYDSTLTWRAFWNYLALACAFWAVRDWLLHPARPQEPGRRFPERFRALFWLIAINTTALALEGIFQKLAGADKLLWLRFPYEERADLMFGPFAFRDNAAQYFNLAWPAILGFWWLSREEARGRAGDGPKVGGGPHIFLLLCTVLIAAAPMIATSASGTLLLAVLLGLVLFLFFLSRRGNWRSRCSIALVCAAVVALGGALGWDQLAPRLRELFTTPYANPSEVYENAKQMALDYPLYGTGPGSFRAIYHLYRVDPQQSWQAFLHDDWLETRVTFGWAGSMFVLCLLCLGLTRWFVPGGVSASWEFVALLWAAVGGCLAVAKFSFPLQVYSILLLLLVFLAVLSCLSRPEGTG
jgi:hypothetical protein